MRAVVYKAYDEARRAAAGVLPDGPFKGVPFLIKDLGRRVAGWPCSMGSVFAQTGPAAKDSVLVKRYRDAGVVLLGATNTPEFGIPGVTHSSRLGLCKNPWNAAYTPGGSRRCRAERQTMWSTTRPHTRPSPSGSQGLRSRVGFRPTSPQHAAGMRIEPRPSLAWAIGTIPDATAAAAPPDERLPASLAR